MGSRNDDKCMIIKIIKTLIIIIIIIIPPETVRGATDVSPWWDIQSVDTMKYSRDLAREKEKDASFDAVIDQHASDIAKLNATHMVVATPYDGEFIPMIQRWTDAGRRYGLSIWFRGNFSGWEGWFEYPSITEEQHLALLDQFIRNHAYLFKDGDIFSPCPECENGRKGDPRHSGNVDEYRKFLIREYSVCTDAFKKIKKDVSCKYFSMNADVARLIMDKETTKALGGIVTIDHYVRDPKVLARDIQDIAAASGGIVMLGEFGAPIPDIHGNMTEQQQNIWVSDASQYLREVHELAGVNYWLLSGGSTALYHEDGTAKPAVESVRSMFTAQAVRGNVTSDLGVPLENIRIHTNHKTVTTDSDGSFTLAYLPSDSTVEIEGEGFEYVQTDIETLILHPDIQLTPAYSSILARIIHMIHAFFYSFINS